VVQPGDTLSDLAVRFDVTVAALVEANRLANARAIVSGHTLLIPTPTTTTPPTTAPPAAGATPPSAAPADGAPTTTVASTTTAAPPATTAG
jgi:LysM repeat protein